MSLYTSARCKLCRREREKLFLKGSKCNTAKCALERRNKAPGQHGAKRTRFTEFSIRLREKQKAKRMYGMREKQFKKFFELAYKQPGNTAENLIVLLERRLDNVIYRLNYASSRAQARQIVSHRHILVNNRKVNIPSFLVNAGDVITVSRKSAEYIKGIAQQSRAQLTSSGKGVNIPNWLTVISDDPPTARVNRIPEFAEISVPLNPQLIVEFYTR